jgi:hypothetical protein
MPKRRRQQGASPPARADAVQRRAGKPRLSFNEFSKAVKRILEPTEAVKRIMEPTEAAKRIMESTEVVKRIMRDCNAAMAKAEPPSPEQRRKEVAKVIAARVETTGAGEAAKAIAAMDSSHLKPIERAEAKKKLSPGRIRQYDRAKLKELYEQHPQYTSRELVRLYEQATGTRPSIPWVDARRREFRRQK